VSAPLVKSLPLKLPLSLMGLLPCVRPVPSLLVLLLASVGSAIAPTAGPGAMEEAGAIEAGDSPDGALPSGSLEVGPERSPQLHTSPASSNTTPRFAVITVPPARANLHRRTAARR